MGRISFSVTMHAAPVSVSCTPENAGAVTLYFSETSYPDITMFCGNADMAIDLHAAIKTVIGKHAARTAKVAQDAA